MSTANLHLSPEAKASLPRHVAVIMDGNGRWANRRDKPRVSGHRAGAVSVRETVETSARLGIGYLTLYAFSTENWKRPRLEVDTLMRLLRLILSWFCCPSPHGTSERQMDVMSLQELLTMDNAEEQIIKPRRQGFNITAGFHSSRCQAMEGHNGK